jgi:hypothetical protein
MRKALILGTLLCLFCAAAEASAQAPGRYQAMLIQVGDPTTRVFPKIFIFDTQNGDMWLWYQEAGSEPTSPRGGYTGPVRNNLLYQGKLRQGKEPGELLHSNTIPGPK